MSERILVIIQARFGSTRLMGKALMPLTGVPLIVYLIRRLKCLPACYKIVVATTDKKEDDLIAAWAQHEQIEVIRGEEDDVLSRYIRCLAAFPSDVIVRVTADNPLTCPNLLSEVSRIMREGGYEYVRAIYGFPVGIGVDAFSSGALMRLHKISKSDYEREHIDAYVLSHLCEFKTKELQPSDDFSGSSIRLTVDTHKDYEYIKGIVESFPWENFISPKDAIARASKRDI